MKLLIRQMNVSYSSLCGQIELLRALSWWENYSLLSVLNGITEETCFIRITLLFEKKINNYFRSSSTQKKKIRTPQSPPKKQQQACLEKMKTVYSIHNTVSLFNPGGISSWLICHFSPLCVWSMCSSTVINCQAFARCPFTPSLQRERDPKPC